MLYRDATLDDLLVVEALENATFDNAFNATTIENEILTGAHCLVTCSKAEGAQGVICGYAIYRVTDSLTDLMRIAVTEKERGTGVGSSLLGYVMSLSPRTMLCVRKANPRALKLYLRHGFHIVGEIEQSWVMLTS
jgi:ribosomal protein S18 acetylase RimI-like enzyme